MRCPAPSSRQSWQQKRVLLTVREKALGKVHLVLKNLKEEQNPSRKARPGVYGSVWYYNIPPTLYVGELSWEVCGQERSPLSIPVSVVSPWRPPCRSTFKAPNNTTVTTLLSQTETDCVDQSRGKNKRTIYCAPNRRKSRRWWRMTAFPIHATLGSSTTKPNLRNIILVGWWKPCIQLVVLAN